MISVSKLINYYLEILYYYFSDRTSIVFSMLGLIYYSILAAISTTVVAIIISFGSFYKFLVKVMKRSKILTAQQIVSNL